MGRTLRPVLDAASGNLLILLARHQRAPCPSDAEIVEWTGLPRRRLKAWLAGLAARGVIEIEYSGQHSPLRRRMRAAGGVWTGFTQRGSKSRAA